MVIDSRPVVVLVSVQGVQNGSPQFKFTRFEGAPILSLRALKNFWAFVYDCIFGKITYYLLENLAWFAI